MALQGRFKGGGGGNNIKTPGEYTVEIKEAKAGHSKNGKPMLTVVFENFEGKRINGYYLREYTHMMAALVEVKKSAGLDGNAPAEMLISKSLNILVEAREPDDQGRIFMDITDYGPAAQQAGDTLAPGGGGKSGF